MDESCVHSEECGLDYCSYDMECPFYEEKTIKGWHMRTDGGAQERADIKDRQTRDFEGTAI